MGTLTVFFEAQKRDTKGRLSRILVIADSSVASEALIRMLRSYYTKDDAQDKYLDNRLPDVRVLDTGNSVESQFEGWKWPHWMEYTKVGAADNILERIGIAFENGKILQSKVENDGEISLEGVVNGFATNCRREASLILWSKIISSFARHGNYDVVLYPETATRIASKVLTLTSQGRGFTVPWECGSFVKMPNGSSNRIYRLIYRSVCRKTTQGSVRHGNKSISRYSPRYTSLNPYKHIAYCRREFIVQ